MATVLIPYRWQRERFRPLRWVHREWTTRHPDWPVRIASAPADHWCKAAAIMDAAVDERDEILVIADADVWCERIEEAVAVVEAGATWAVPHLKVHRHTEEGTAAILTGADPVTQSLERPSYVGMEGGGIVVVRRETLLEIPFDRRFVGWGREDCAWRDAMLTLVGKPWRGKANLIHLWHPPQPELGRDRVTSRTPASEALYACYEAARRRPDQMRALIAEAVAVQPVPTQRSPA